MTPSTGEQRHSVLEHLVERLEFDTVAFEPARDIRSARDHHLPGREPGAHLESSLPRVTLASAVILDCGISRRDTYTHVLWVSLSVEAILGSYAASRLAETISALEYITGYEWEGHDRLHLRAPGADWDHVLADARRTVDALVN